MYVALCGEKNAEQLGCCFSLLMFVEVFSALSNQTLDGIPDIC